MSTARGRNKDTNVRTHQLRLVQMKPTAPRRAGLSVSGNRRTRHRLALISTNQPAKHIAADGGGGGLSQVSERICPVPA